MIAAAHLSEFISHPLLIVLVGASLIMFALTINAFFLIWVERKLSARNGWRRMSMSRALLPLMLSAQLAPPVGAT